MRTTKAYDFCKDTLASSQCPQVLVLGDVGFPPQKPSPEFAQRLQQQVSVYEEDVTHEIYGKLPLICICLYEQRAFPPSFIAAAEHAHQVLVAAVSE